MVVRMYYVDRFRDYPLVFNKEDRLVAHIVTINLTSCVGSTFRRT